MRDFPHLLCVLPTLCTLPPRYPYIDTLYGGVTLAEYSKYIQYPCPDVYSILYQMLFASATVALFCNIKQADPHGGNVTVQKLANPVTLRFLYFDVEKKDHVLIEFTTSVLVKMIDWARTLPVVPYYTTPSRSLSRTTTRLQEQRDAQEAEKSLHLSRVSNEAHVDIKSVPFDLPSNLTPVSLYANLRRIKEEDVALLSVGTALTHSLTRLVNHSLIIVAPHSLLTYLPHLLFLYYFPFDSYRTERCGTPIRGEGRTSSWVGGIMRWVSICCTSEQVRIIFFFMSSS